MSVPLHTHPTTFSPAFLLGVKEFAFLLSQENVVVRADLGSSLGPILSRVRTVRS